jgi:rare lipoprotein A
VTRLDGGQRVVVRINDRGPFVRGRIIDLSHAAARRLDMVREGVVPVTIEVVNSPDRSGR